MKHFVVVSILTMVICNSVFTQWVQTNGPFGGDVRAFAFNGSNILAGTSTGGVYFSTNNGTNWSAASSGLTNLMIQAAVATPSKYFVGTAGSSGGVFVTTNNGSSWSPVSSGLPSSIGINALLVSGTNLFAGTEQGIFLSADDGASWNSAIGNLNYRTDKGIKTLAISGSNIYMSTSDSVFVTTNNGTTWTSKSAGLIISGGKGGNPPAIVNTLVINGSTLYAATNNGVYKSIDNGTSWAASNSGLTGVGLNTNSLVLKGTNLFVATGSGVFSSADNGASWSSSSSGLPNTIVKSLGVNGTTIYAGVFYNGIYQSTDDGTSWSSLNNGLINSYARTIVAKGSNVFTGTYGQGAFLSTDNGDTWTAVNSGMTKTTVNCFAVSGSNIFAGTNSGGLYKSTNDGTLWTLANGELPTSYDVYTLLVSGTKIFAGTGGLGLYYSTDDGAQWTNANLPLSSRNNSVSTLYTDGSTIYVGMNAGSGLFKSTNNGATWDSINTGLNTSNSKVIRSITKTGSALFIATYDYVYLSTNDGASWTKVNNGLPNPTTLGLISNGSNVLVSSGSGVYLTTDNGANWTSKTPNLGNEVVYAFCSNGTSVFATSYDAGVWKRPLSEILPVELVSFNAQSKQNSVELIWNTATEVNNYGFEIERRTTPVSPPLQGGDVRGGWGQVGFVEGSGTTNAPKEYLFIDKNITANKYSYRLKQIDRDGKFEYSQAVEVTVGAVLKKFALEQNYPNPFNPSTVINYQLPMNSHVTLKIYDVLGKEVATLVNENKNVGSYYVQFDATKLSSGVYFYQLHAGNNFEIKRMLLMK